MVHRPISKHYPPNSEKILEPEEVLEEAADGTKDTTEAEAAAMRSGRSRNAARRCVSTLHALIDDR